MITQYSKLLFLIKFSSILYFVPCQAVLEMKTPFFTFFGTIWKTILNQKRIIFILYDNTRTSKVESSRMQLAPASKIEGAPPFQWRHSQATGSKNTTAFLTFLRTSAHQAWPNSKNVMNRTHLTISNFKKLWFYIRYFCAPRCRECQQDNNNSTIRSWLNSIQKWNLGVRVINGTK